MSVRNFDLRSSTALLATCFLQVRPRDPDPFLAASPARANCSAASDNSFTYARSAPAHSRSIDLNLLGWVANEPDNRKLRVASDFPHEEIAQKIGLREKTVTRLLRAT